MFRHVEYSGFPDIHQQDQNLTIFDECLTSLASFSANCRTYRLKHTSGSIKLHIVLKF